MSAVVRPASTADLEAVMRIERSSFESDAWSAGAMLETLGSVESAAFVAEEDGVVVGYAAVLAARGAQEADVLTIAVAAEQRGRGTGRALLQTLVDAAERRGAREVFLEVRADNPVAEALYVSEGFERVGIRRAYYQPDGVDAVVMRRTSPAGVARLVRPEDRVPPVGGAL